VVVCLYRLYSVVVVVEGRWEACVVAWLEGGIWKRFAGVRVLGRRLVTIRSGVCNGSCAVCKY